MQIEALLLKQAKQGWRRLTRYHPEFAPMVVFLHGSGERSTDNKLQMKFGVHDILEFSMENNDPAIILVPQLPIDQQWVDLPWDTDLTVMQEQPSQSMQLAIELMNDYLAKFPVDRNRILLLDYQ